MHSRYKASANFSMWVEVLCHTVFTVLDRHTAKVGQLLLNTLYYQSQSEEISLQWEWFKPLGERRLFKTLWAIQISTVYDSCTPVWFNQTDLVHGVHDMVSYLAPCTCHNRTHSSFMQSKMCSQHSEGGFL